MDINSIEELAVNSINDCANAINNHIEELISKNINEQELINKKKQEWKFHLIENIYDYAKYIFNEDMKKVEKFKNKIIGYCYSREYNLIVKELKKYKDVTIPKTVCNLPVYLENNKNKIDYSTYEYNGWFVGSGAIESSNKTVVQLRLKQAGMRWSVDGANYVIALRCMWESDHWDKIEKIVVNEIYH